MNYIEFNHNFCESRLQNNLPPEILNAYSSFFISLIPIIEGIPDNIYLKNVSYLLMANGVFSFYYHYTLTWFGKHLDEVTMILANYYGINGLLSFHRLNYDPNLKILNLIFCAVFISFNAIPEYDYLFPTIFGCYSFITVYLIRAIANIYEYRKTVDGYLLYSLFGALCWIFSETICNNETKYGHVIWHMLFPYGFYKILKLFDPMY